MTLLQKTLPFFLGIGLMTSASLGQQVRVSAEDPAFEELPSPELGGNTGKKKWDPQDWLECEVKLELEAESSYEENYVDGLSIRWYVAVANPTGNGFFLLEKDVDYVNMPVEEEIFAAVYLAPATIKRLTGSDRADKGAIEGVAGEVSFNGQKVAVFSSRSGDEWWKSPSLSRTEKFPLMSKGETPFKNLWWDRYLQEKENRR